MGTEATDIGRTEGDRIAEESSHCAASWSLQAHASLRMVIQRVESLAFLMMIDLTTYFLLQRVFRQNTPLDATVKERLTTTVTLLRSFATYTILVFHRSPFLCQVCPTRMTTCQPNILNRLNFTTPAQILSRRLLRLPNN